MRCISAFHKLICVDKNIVKIADKTYICNSYVESLLDDINTQNEEEVFMLMIFLDGLCVPEK